MRAIILVIFVSLTANAGPGVDFYCKDDYVAEAKRLNDLYLNGDESKQANETLDGRHKRKMIGAIIGGAAVAALTFKPLNNYFEQPIFAGLFTYGVSAYAGGLPGYLIAGKTASKETKNKEKLAEKYLKELKYLFDTTVRGHTVVTASKVIVDRANYLPQEVEASMMTVGLFITEYKLELLPSEAATLIVSADTDGRLCPNHDPMTSYEIANLLKE